MNTCKDCIHYDYHNTYKDFGFCKRYNTSVNSNYFCKSFLQCAADFVKQYREKIMNKFQKNLEEIADEKEKNLQKKTCYFCAHFQERKGYEDHVCKLHNQRISSGYYCNDFLQYDTFSNEEKQNTNDPINPDHYKQGKLTCKEICESMCANKVGIEAAHVFNITKYIYRYNMKDGIKDVRKAREYCDFLIAHLEEKETE